jgi:hypothetical protein
MSCRERHSQYAPRPLQFEWTWPGSKKEPESSNSDTWACLLERQTRAHIYVRACTGSDARPDTADGFSRSCTHRRRDAPRLWDRSKVVPLNSAHVYAFWQMILTAVLVAAMLITWNTFGADDVPGPSFWAELAERGCREEIHLPCANFRTVASVLSWLLPITLCICGLIIVRLLLTSAFPFCGFNPNSKLGQSDPDTNAIEPADSIWRPLSPPICSDRLHDN